MKKRFDEISGKPSLASRNRASAKKVRFKEAETEENHPQSHTFDPCSAPCEPTIDTQASSKPKTSEYAFFKKLKCSNRDGKEGIPSRSFRPSNSLGESGGLKYKDPESSFYVKKSSSSDVSTFLSPKVTAFENSDLTKDHKWFKSSVILKTPRTIDLGSFLSANTDASAKPAAQSEDHDIFSLKRLKLKQQIEKTLFPEVVEVPKECDLVSLLLHRLLPENCGNLLTRTPNLRLEVEDKFQQCYLPDSNIQFEDNWGSSLKHLNTGNGYFSHDGGSTVWSREFRDKLPSCQRDEGMDHSGVCHVDRMLLGYPRIDAGCCLSDTEPESWSNRLRDANLLMWRDEGYDNSTESWSNQFQERNMLKWREDDNDNGYSTESWSNKYRETNLLKWRDDDDDNYSTPENVVGSPHSYKSSDKAHSYRIPDEHYDTIITKTAVQESAHNYRDDNRSEYGMANSPMLSSDQPYGSAVHCSFERYRSSESSDLKEYAEPRPLLLPWRTDELDIQGSPHTTTKLDSYELSSTGSEHHLLGQASSYEFQDHNFQRCTPLPSSYGSEQLNLGDAGLLKNIFRDSHLFMLPQNHLPSAGLYDINRSSMEPLLLPQNSNSDPGLKFSLLPDFSDRQHDISANDVRILREENSSSKFPFENENASQTIEDWSLVSTRIPSDPEVSLPQLHQVRWMDAESEASEYVMRCFQMPN